MDDYVVRLPKPHPRQRQFVDCDRKRIIIRAGRRGGKTVGIAIRNVLSFLAGKRVLYAAPTSDQLGRWWATVTTALAEPIAAGVFYKNETEHIIELRGTEQRLRGKTAWNADTLRGDYADELTLDEWQLMDEDAWELVGAPMMLDKDGKAIFIYTPPSLHSRSVSKARDPQHAAKMFKRAEAEIADALARGEEPRWAVFHFTSRDNPYLSRRALTDITRDMTALAIRQEIDAMDIDEAPGALWTREDIERARVERIPTRKEHAWDADGKPVERVVTALERVVVGLDPSGSSSGAEAGIVVAGRSGEDYYTLDDVSRQGSPDEWGRAAIDAYHHWRADVIVAEANYGGEMVRTVIEQIDRTVNVKLVNASRGKAVRAEPISAISQQGRDHHVGAFPALEDELCLWIPGDKSPNRLDAKVWAYTDLMNRGEYREIADPFED